MNPKIQVALFGASGALGSLVKRFILTELSESVCLNEIHRKEKGNPSPGKGHPGDCPVIYNPCTHWESLSRDLKGMDYAIVTVPQRDPLIQRACLDAGVHCFDVNISLSFYDKLLELDSQAKEKGILLAYMTGYFPGLSGMMVKKLLKEYPHPREVQVGMLSSTVIRHPFGVSGMLQMLESISRPVHYYQGQGKEIYPGFSKTSSMNFPQLKSRVLLASYDERELLRRGMESLPLNYWIGSDSPAFLNKLFFLNKIGFFRPFIMQNRTPRGERKKLRRARIIQKAIKVDPSKPENTALAIQGVYEGSQGPKQRSIRAVVPSDYWITAVIASRLVLIHQTKKAAGVCTPHQIIELDPFLEFFTEEEIHISWDEAPHSD